MALLVLAAFLAIATPTAAEIIIDNGTAGTSFTGSWCVSSAPAPFGTNSLYSCSAAVETYRWTPSIPATEAHDVFVWWTSNGNRSTSVPISVVHAGGTTTRSFNQRVGGGQWQLHGRYTFNAGTAGHVQTSDANGPQASADAVRFVPVGGAPPLPTVTIAATAASAPEGGAAGVFTVNRTGATTTALGVSYTVGGTATPGSDYAALSGSVTIPAGAASATISVSAVADSTAESPETVIVTLSSSTAYEIGSPGSATVTITDAPAPGIITIDNGTAGTSFTGSWCVSSAPAPFGTNSLYSCSGAVDTYRWTPSIPTTGTYDVQVWWTSNGNRSTSVPISVVHAGGTTTTNFNQRVGGGQWQLHGRYTFNAGTAGHVQTSDANGPQASADAVRFVPVGGGGPTLPTVTVTASTPSAPEGGAPGAFTVSRMGATTSALAVSYTVGGTATPGTDYPALSGSVTIPAGAASATISVTAVADGTAESAETVILTLSASAAYEIGSPGSATVTITDAPAPGIITIDNGTAGTRFTGSWCVSSAPAPFGTNSLYSCGAGVDTYRWTPSIPATGTWEVQVWWTSNGNRSTNVPISVVHGGGTTTRSFNQRVGGGQWQVHGRYTFNAGTAGHVQTSDANGPQASADAVRFVPIDGGGPTPPTVTVTATAPGASEGGASGAFTVARTGSTAAALTVTYATGGTATSGGDYAALPGTVTIPAGAATATIGVVPVADAVLEAPETLQLSLSAGASYTLGTPATATVTITDDARTPGRFAYVTNKLGHTVSVVDTAFNAVAATVPVGQSPFGVAAGKKVYVANLDGNTVSVIERASHAVVGTIAVGARPFGVAADAAGSRVYVTNATSSTVSVIDAVADTVVATVPVAAAPRGVAVHPRGTAAYVVSVSGIVSVIDAATATVTATIALGLNAQGITVSPDGNRLFVVHHDDDLVSVVDTATRSVVGSIVVGDSPRAVAVHPTGSRLYVTNAADSTVSVIDAASASVVATIPVGASPEGLAVRPAGDRLFVANTGSGTLSTIDTQSHAVVGTTTVGSGPGAFGDFVASTGAVGPRPLTVRGPGIDPTDFRSTVFATGLNFPQGMTRLADGSLLVGTSRPFTNSFFASTGELIRLVDADDDGVADGPGTVLFTGLPGGVTAVRRADSLIFVSSVQAGSERISILRSGGTPAAPLSLVTSINFTFPADWEHKSYALEVVRVAPLTYELFFNVGSSANATQSTATVTASGLISESLAGASIYSVTLRDTGGVPEILAVTQIALGLRNAAGVALHPGTGDLYFEDNGIDGLQDRNEALSADEINRIPAADIGVRVPHFGFPANYTEYRTGRVVGGAGEQPLVTFQPIAGSESEGPFEIAFAPAGFPPGVNNGIFVGFHGKFAQGGIANEENPVVYWDFTTGQYFHFIDNNEPEVGHLDGLLATESALFLSDFSSKGGVSGPAAVGGGVIYQIKAR